MKLNHATTIKNWITGGPLNWVPGRLPIFVEFTLHNSERLTIWVRAKKFSKTAKITKAVQNYLLESNYAELEDKLVKHFGRHFAR